MGKRFREYGFTVGNLRPGLQNSITDVPGVSVGHVTLNSGTGYGDSVCTGVTAILPHQGSVHRDKVSAAAHVINGFGKTTGLVQVEELSEIEAPIMLTNTFSVPAVTEGTLKYMLEQDLDIGDSSGSLNIVVGECNDSYLNDMRGMHVRPKHAVEAIESAVKGEPVTEGSVGAGTGMRCFGWKGGIGTSSRRVEAVQGSYVVGTLVLTNFGDPSDLTMLGASVGEFFRLDQFGESGTTTGLNQQNRVTQDGSVIVVVATDAPLNGRQLKRLAKRAAFGLARTGSIAHHGSGDIVIAFSTPKAGNLRTMDITQNLPEAAFISDYFRAVVESTEEAVLNSLTVNCTTAGRKGRILSALPMQTVTNLLNSRYPDSH